MPPEARDEYKEQEKRPVQEETDAVEAGETVIESEESPAGNLKIPVPPPVKEVSVLEELPEDDNEQKEEEPPMPDGPLSVWQGVAKFFYDVFNPFLVPAYATLLLFELSLLGVTVPGAAIPYALTVLGATAVIPVVALIGLRKFGLISSLSLTGRKERTVPYVISILTFIAVTLLFVFRGAPTWLWTLYCGATTTVVVNLLINFKLKISNHASGVAALLAMFMVIQNHGVPLHDLSWWVIGTTLLCGIIGTAALMIGRHRLRDVLAGYVTGFLPIILFSLI